MPRLTPCPRLAPRVRRAIDALTADGITLSADEVAWLADLDRRATDPGAPASMAMPGCPVAIGGEQFWPWHARACSWYVRAYDLCPDMADAALLYSHVRSAPGDRSLDLLQSEADIRAALGQWRAACAIHDENIPAACALVRALDGDCGSVIPAPDERRDDRPPGTHLSWAADLCETFPGTSPDYWMSGISIAEVRAMLDARSSQTWATSQRRTEALIDCMRAVKWLRWSRDEAEGDGHGE